MVSTPPRFETVASDVELAQTLGAQYFGAFLTLALLAQPQADLPSGWAVSGSMDDFGVMLGVTSPTALSIVRGLESYRLVYRQHGRNLGKNIGRLRSRIWLTYDPVFPYPGNPSPTKTSLTKNSPMKSLSMIQGHTDAVDNSETSLSQASFLSSADQPLSVIHSSEKNVSDVMNDIHSLEKNSSHSSPETFLVSTPLSECPAPMRAALLRLGWNGPVPAVDPEVVTALAVWVANQPPGRFTKNGGAWLRAVLSKPGEATTLAAELGLLAFSAHTAEVLAHQPTTTVMDKTEYDSRCIDDPAWEAAIDVEATRRAQEQGVKISMLLKRTVATQWIENDKFAGEVTS
jgi:hypothetical protein